MPPLCSFAATSNILLAAAATVRCRAVVHQRDSLLRNAASSSSRLFLRRRAHTLARAVRRTHLRTQLERRKHRSVLRVNHPWFVEEFWTHGLHSRESHLAGPAPRSNRAARRRLLTAAAALAATLAP